jgi:hypothetical protein
MKRPSFRSALLLFGVVTGLAAYAADEPRTPGSSTVSNRPVFVCQAFVRPSVEVALEPMGEIRMTEQGDRSVRSGAFRFRVLYSNDGYEGRSIVTYVYSTSTGKLIERSLFQLHRDKAPVHQFIGGHGFTGLHYVYAPDSPAELQYFCSYG